MITTIVYFKVENSELFNGETGYVKQQLEFDTKENPKGLENIHKLPEILRENVADGLKVDKSSVFIISNEEYERETD